MTARPRFGDLQRMEDEVTGGDTALYAGERGVPMGEERGGSAARGRLRIAMVDLLADFSKQWGSYPDLKMAYLKLLTYRKSGK